MPEIDGDVLDQLEAILRQHRGPDQAITSSELAAKLDVDDAAANLKTREAVRVLCDERHLPVAASSRGYYVLETRAQLEDYLGDLDGRIAGIQERKELAAAWNRRRLTADGGEA